MTDRAYLELLSRNYPTSLAAAAEIINLNAICQLPKGTEYFFSDLHGEYDAFHYLLSSASGVIRDKIEMLFSKSVSVRECDELAALIYDTEHVLLSVRGNLSGSEFDSWCKITIFRLVQVCKAVSSKYTRSKVRKKIPPDFSYIIDELLHADANDNKGNYYDEIIASIVLTGTASDFITQICMLIRSCTIDQLHILGDIFDRGPHADRIFEELLHFHDVDIQWGNHDIAWMGAFAGNRACVASVLRRAVGYNNFDQLEDGYGINLRALSMFASEVYKDDPCDRFIPHTLDESVYDPVELPLAAKMYKAMAVIEMKLEEQLLLRHPEYKMADRVFLPEIDYEKGTVPLDGREYKLLDTSFPTIDPADPLRLSPEENQLIDLLTTSFRHSVPLKKDIHFLLSHGSMYKIVNKNLLYHGCIPMTEEGDFEEVELDGHLYKGRSYLDAVNEKVKRAFFAPEGSKEKEDAVDFFWYLWAGPKSPLFGKSKIATFERWFIEDKKTHTEVYNPYYTHVKTREACELILSEFGLDPAESHIINGHVPVKEKEGESPVRGGGLLYVIDGGISKAYQRQTGFGGYTLIYNSHRLALAQHKPYSRTAEDGSNQAPYVRIVDTKTERVLVRDTDNGKVLKGQIDALYDLLAAYRAGSLKEKQ